MKKILSTMAFILLISACSTKTSHLSVVVPENIRFTTAELNRATVKRNVSGESWRPVILVFPIGFPKFETALDEALQKGVGDVMTNVTVVDELQWYILFGYNKVTVNGDVVNTRR